MHDQEAWGVEGGDQKGNENTWLKSLNAGILPYYTPPGDRMCPAATVDPGDKVRVAVFAGNETGYSIGNIHCLNHVTVSSFYEDGIPSSPRDDADKVEWVTGDGTVPYESAVLPDTEGWGKLLGSTSDVPHSALVAHFTEEIVVYLKGNTTTSMAHTNDTLGEILDEPEEAPASLTITLTGDVRIQVTDTLANRTGIAPSTGDVLEEIPGGTCTFMGTSGGVTVEGPPAGAYTVTYFGEVPKDFTLTFYYQDGEMNQQVSLRGFCPPDARTLTVTVDGITGMTVTTEVGSPTGLTAEPYVSGESLLTRLTWTPPSGETVSGYRLYGAEVNAGTSPVSPDTDGDGYWDGIEMEGKSDPLDDLSIPSIHVNPDGLCCGKVICCTSIAEGIATSQTWGRLKVIEGTADEAVLLADPKYIYLQGGWNTEFTVKQGATAIRSLTLESGFAIIESLSIGPCSD